MMSPFRAFSMFAEFSRMNASGSVFSMVSMAVMYSWALGSSMYCRLPAVEKGWQGGPATYSVIFLVVVVLLVMSLWMAWAVWLAT